MPMESPSSDHRVAAVVASDEPDTRSALAGARRSSKALSREEMEAKIEALFDEYALSKFSRAAAHSFVAKMAHDTSGAYDRVRSWFVWRLNGFPGGRWIDAWQRACPQIVPGLRALPFWDSSELPWMRTLEESFDGVKEELLALRHKGGFQPYRSPVWSATSRAPDGVGGLAHDSGEWNVFYLFLHNVPFDENCAKCPRTVELLRAVPRMYAHVFFSNMAPHTHITKHHGPTNKKLRVHLPLVVPDPSLCRLRVGGKVHCLEEGRCYAFDDSFEHEAWNDSDSSRIVLILDIWHPDLTGGEVKFLHFLQQAQMREERRMTEAATQAAREGAEARAEAVAEGAHGVVLETAVDEAGDTGQKAADAAGEGPGVEGEPDNLYVILERTRRMEPDPNNLWAGVESGSAPERPAGAASDGMVAAAEDA